VFAVSNYSVHLPREHGWTHVVLANATVWFKGYIHIGSQTFTGLQAANTLAQMLPHSLNGLESSLAGLDGLFAVVIEKPVSIIAAVDRIASIPLLICDAKDGPYICDGAVTRAAKVGHNTADNPDGILAVSMSGYTIGRSTIMADTIRMTAGDYMILDQDGKVRLSHYYRYRAWEGQDNLPRDWTISLKTLLQNMFEQLAASLDGRCVAIPLSAGLDSRLIASGLKNVGYDNVKCFAYGKPGNHEAQASKEIAARLGFKWQFVPYSVKLQRDAFASKDHGAYRQYADSLASVPFEQEFLALRTLTDNGWITRDDIIINGQSGDYNTGNHIPRSVADFSRAASGQEKDAALVPVLNALIEKHYSLWTSLKTPAAVERIGHLLTQGLRDGGAPMDDPQNSFALYEFSEFENRQSKYTVGGQRVYEFFGLDWRLPLWEEPFVEFWRTVPLAHKYNQVLYRETLENLNWGGVWTDINRDFYITPSWLRAPRSAVKVAAAPFGQNFWRHVDRRVFAYWIDVLSNYAAEPYWKIATDSRGARNAFSWFSMRYLERHGIDFNTTSWISLS